MVQNENIFLGYAFISNSLIFGMPVWGKWKLLGPGLRRSLVHHILMVCLFVLLLSAQSTGMVMVDGQFI